MHWLLPHLSGRDQLYRNLTKPRTGAPDMDMEAHGSRAADEHPQALRLAGCAC